MLPDVQGLRGLDIGCGEGANTGKLAQRGARMTAVDISPTFIRHACESKQDISGTHYLAGSAVRLPFRDAAFDFAVAFMSLMDVSGQESALGEAFRVVKAGGFLQYSISHPATDASHRKNLRGADGKTYALELGGYYERIDGRIDEWIFGAVPAELKKATPKFRTPRFHRTLSEWLNNTMAAGFMLERIEEPTATDETVHTCPDMQDTQVMPYFLHVRARKPK